MPYLIPKRLLRDSRPLEEKEVNSLLQPAANKVQGGLGEHDFETGACNNENIADGAYYDHHDAEQVVDPDFTTSNTPKVGGNGPDATFVVPNDKQWHTITGTTVTSVMQDSILWIAAQLQYTHHDWTKGDTYKSSVQFAIRVDGEIMEEDTTGRWEQTRENWNAMRTDAPKSDASLIGARVMHSDNAHSLGAQHRPVRLGYTYRVSPGQHSIELIARRVAVPARLAYLTNDDYIEVYTRRIHAVEVPLIAQGNNTNAAAVTAPWMEDGTVMSKAEYETGRLDNIIAAYNDLNTGNLDRESLNHNHLPSAVFYAHQEVLDGTLTNLTNEYPGWASATIGDPGWTQINDGTDNLQLVNQLNFPAYGDCWLVVMADIEIAKVFGTNRFGFDNFGNLCLMSYYNAAWHVIGTGATEVSFNAHFVFTDLVEHDMNLWVSMLYVVKLTNPAQAWDRIGLFGSTWDGSGGNDNVTMAWRNASIKALVLRP